MERVELYCQERPRGEITLDPRGSRTRVRASMDDPGDGLYRAALLGERGELLLGVLEPAEGRLVLRRELYSRDIARLGPSAGGRPAAPSASGRRPGGRRRSRTGSFAPPSSAAA